MLQNNGVIIRLVAINWNSHELLELFSLWNQSLHNLIPNSKHLIKLIFPVDVRINYVCQLYAKDITTLVFILQVPELLYVKINEQLLYVSTKL